MIRRILTTVFLALLVASPALAQTGQINGVVTDNTGGVVPGASVKAVETATGASRDTVTGADGRYTFTSLRPATYDISAELTGFRTSQRKGVQLQANQNLTANFALELGNLAETVTVSGEAATVDISSATISEVVDSKRIVELPLNGRDAAKLSTLVAGMVLTAVDQESGKTIPGALRLSTNGTESRQVSFRLDGTNHTDPYFQQNQPFPFPDALQEFSIQTSNYSAAQGNSAGAVVNAVTRSGTNDFHGGAFGYARDNTFNSKNVFAATKDFLKRKQYGGFLGGPIQHNRTFFFAGWQGTRIQNVGGTLTGTVPTAEQRAGNFGSTTIRDPLTGQPFPNNQIPLDRMDPASLNVLKYIPVPGADGRISIPRRIGTQDDQIIIKGDQLVGEKDQFSVRYFWDKFHNDPTYTEGNLLSYRNPTLAAGTKMQNILGSHTRTMSPTLLNEVRFGYNRTMSRRFPPDGVPSMQQLGVRLPIYPTLPSISEINANNFFNIGDNLEASFFRPGYELNDRMTWVKGKHNMQFGGEWQHYVVEIRNEFRRAGHFMWAGSTTSGTGNTLADFMVGSLSQFDQGTGEYKDYVVNYGSAFIQDDYKVSSNLSLNLGLRFEPSPPWHEKVGRIELFTLEDYANNVHSQMFPKAPRGETFRGDPGVPEDGTNAATNNWGGRFGFAWDITGDGKTSLRGGGGSFFDQHRDGESGNGAVNAAPWNLRLSVTRPGATAGSGGPFSDPYRGRSDFNLITDGVIGTQQAIFPTPVLIETLAEDYVTPVTYNYNLTFEREVAQGIMARAAYVGSRNRNGRWTWELNPANPLIAGATTGNTDARRAFAADGIGNTNQQVQDRTSNYNSMQLTLAKRYSHNFQATANYTLSKVEGDFGNQLIPYTGFQDPALMWGPLDQDHRHRFTMSWVWDMPGANLEGVSKWVLYGWQLSGVMQYQTGRPYTVTSGSDNSLDSIGNDRAKLTGADVNALPSTICVSCAWAFNPAAFATNDTGTYGNVAKGAYYGPTLHGWDMSLSKNFRFSSSQYVQFRAEFFNVFNQVNFDIPNTAVNNAATLGRITRTDPAAGDPRIIQFGLKYVF
ncbi:MAG: carboxypeptidase-like regulatory domain-containing protein [Vicinamibacterales bacterium]|nr:carboxypeptidase-like regulatory domain-containing protein [Vicinamibacterales bacterium]